MHIVEIADIITGNGNFTPLDVRSEGEFLQGHIPNAVNVPLLNNEERRQVGICFTI